MMIRAVLFDMDGLLVDSERVGLDVMQESALRQGIALPWPLIMQTLGATGDFSKQLYQRHFPTIDPELLFADFWNAMRARARDGKMPLKKGAPELLEALKRKGIPCAVASSSPLETVRLYLEKDGVLPYFSALVTGECGVPSKPAPDIFLKAAEALAVPPAHCLVLEDSRNGVKAGRAAGMQVAMVPDLLPYNDELAPYCDHVLPDLLAALPLVEA